MSYLLTLLLLMFEIVIADDNYQCVIAEEGYSVDLIFPKNQNQEAIQCKFVSPVNSLYERSISDTHDNGRIQLKQSSQGDYMMTISNVSQSDVGVWTNTFWVDYDNKKVKLEVKLGKWGDCSVSCGPGVQMKELLEPEINVGDCTGKMTQDCNEGPCSGTRFSFLFFYRIFFSQSILSSFNQDLPKVIYPKYLLNHDLNHCYYFPFSSFLVKKHYKLT